MGSFEVTGALGALRSLALETPPAWWPDGAWGGWRPTSLNEVLLHLLVETACHAGHLDAARERIDGATFDYSTNQAVRHWRARPPSISSRHLTTSRSGRLAEMRCWVSRQLSRFGYQMPGINRYRVCRA
jgi:hypothetical protein